MSVQVAIDVMMEALMANGSDVVFASIINLETGSLGTDHALPPVKRFGNDYNLVFTYNSTSAFPTGFVMPKPITLPLNRRWCEARCF